MFLLWLLVILLIASIQRTTAIKLRSQLFRLRSQLFELSHGYSDRTIIWAAAAAGFDYDYPALIYLSRFLRQVMCLTSKTGAAEHCVPVVSEHRHREAMLRWIIRS